MAGLGRGLDSLLSESKKNREEKVRENLNKMFENEIENLQDLAFEQRKRKNVIQDARILSYEPSHKKSTKLRIFKK